MEIYKLVPSFQETDTKSNLINTHLKKKISYNVNECTEFERGVTAIDRSGEMTLVQNLIMDLNMKIKFISTDDMQSVHSCESHRHMCKFWYVIHRKPTAQVGPSILGCAANIDNVDNITNPENYYNLSEGSYVLIPHDNVHCLGDKLLVYEVDMGIELDKIIYKWHDLTETFHVHEDSKPIVSRITNEENQPLYNEEGVVISRLLIKEDVILEDLDGFKYIVMTNISEGKVKIGWLTLKLGQSCLIYNPRDILTLEHVEGEVNLLAVSVEENNLQKK